MELTTTKRVMLANLHPGQCIDHIVFDLNGKPAHVQSEIVNIEIHCNFGRLHTIRGALPWQMLTFKYVVLIPQNQRKNYSSAKPTTTTRRALHASNN